MSKYIVEETYATALYHLAQQTDEVEKISTELLSVCRVFQSNKNYFMLLNNPKLGKHEKKQLVRDLFQDAITPTLMNFIMVLFDKRRINRLFGITKRYQKMVNEANNIAEGVVVSAVPLNDQQLAKIAAESSRLIRKTARLINRVEPEIIGGIKVYVDDQLIDASVRSRLKTIGQGIKDHSI